jgi:hypothetical protein
MRNLSDMTANELTKCLCEICGPAEMIFGDGAVKEALDKYHKQIKESTTVQTGFSLFVKDVFPVLMGKHEHEVYTILAAVDGVDADEIKNRNGVEFMRDVFKGFVLDGDRVGIFRPGIEARGE